MSSSRIEMFSVVLDRLMREYSERVPDVKKIIHHMIDEQIIGDASEIQNDHIAFRTMGLPLLGIQSLEKIFIHYGYVRRDYYSFAAKKLNAYWYAPPAPHLPRIFISELKVKELSAEVQQIISSYTDAVVADPVDSLDLNNPHAVADFLHTPLWRLPSLHDYKTLLAASEYAAWAIFNRYYLNHYTIGVHDLKEGYNTVAAFNRFLEQHGIRLNDAGGKIKESPDGLLLQSATVAQVLDAAFANGEQFSIAGSYVEFAERRLLHEYAHLPKEAQQRNHFREGFEAGNADKIFESTFTTQISR